MNPRTLQPRIFFHRLVQWRFQKTHTDMPWLTAGALYLLNDWLRPTDVGFEWGSGQSTAWLAAKSGHVTSVEHDAAWHGIVTGKLRQQNVSQKVDYRLVPSQSNEFDEPASDAYCDQIDPFPSNHFDWILVDGLLRAPCFERAISRVKPGGLLILDNANRYHSNRFHGGHSTVTEPRDEPRSPKWAELFARVATWRAILTTDHLFDTRFWVKPVE